MVKGFRGVRGGGTAGDRVSEGRTGEREGRAPRRARKREGRAPQKGGQGTGRAQAKGRAGHHGGHAHVLKELLGRDGDELDLQPMPHPAYRMPRAPVAQRK